MLRYIRERFHPLWRLRKMAWYRTLQNKIDFTVGKNYGGIKFFVKALRDFSIFISNNDIEMKTHKVFEKIILEFKIVYLFDIGANVGIFSWHALNVNKKLKVFLFEPDVTNVRLLKKTIRFNNLTEVKLWEGVVSNKVGNVEFLIDSISGATGSIIDDTANSSSLHKAYGLSKKVVVSSTCLDSYTNVSDLPSTPILLKIDVEGAESEVFAGAINFIKKFRPIIIVECFEKKNLDLVIEAAYLPFSLPENENYLLVPEEMQQIFVEKDIFRS